MGFLNRRKDINMSNFYLDDSTYQFMKWVAQIVLPALGTFYFAVASIWGLPYAEQIVGTITAVDTLLGALLGISSANHNKEQSEEDDGSNTDCAD